MHILLLAVQYQYLLNKQYLDSGFHYVGSQFVVACIFSRLSWSKLKVPYLLHDYQMTLLAPTNHPRMECEKNPDK